MDDLQNGGIPIRRLDRRHFLKHAVVVAAAALPVRLPRMRRNAMGVSIASYAIRWQSDANSATHPPFRTALDVLAHCSELGAGGVQVGVGGWEERFAGEVRSARERMGLYLEGQVRLPRDRDDLPRFESDIVRGREAGAEIVRTVCLSGRRYETFETADAFRAFQTASRRALEWAEPIVRRHRVRLAVENHKDWRVPELRALLDHLGSEWIGVTLDMGNSISLMEDPMEVVRALAPVAFTTHFKDMAVDAYADGFLLSEVPLGEGILDLPAIVAECERHNPGITFNLEMITRDPLQVPCLTDRYWATFGEVNGRDLARTLRMVRARGGGGTLPRVSGRTAEERLAAEEANNRRSFAFARQHLGMA